MTDTAAFVTFFGTGDAFAPATQRQNLPLVTFAAYGQSGCTLLLDCGTDAKNSIRENGYEAYDIDAVYISHLHADHIGGLEWLVYSRMLNPDLPKPVLFVPAYLELPLWECLRGGLEVTQAKTDNTLHDYFDVHLLQFGETLYAKYNNIAFSLDILEVPHIHELNANHIGTSTALRINYGDSFTKHILYTSDCRYCPEVLDDWYRSSDLILQDCSKYQATVHASYYDLKGLATEIKAKMLLCHYQPGFVFNKEDGFLGMAWCGEVYYPTQGDRPQSTKSNKD